MSLIPLNVPVLQQTVQPPRILSTTKKPAKSSPEDDRNAISIPANTLFNLRVDNNGLACEPPRNSSSSHETDRERLRNGENDAPHYDNGTVQQSPLVPNTVVTNQGPGLSSNHKYPNVYSHR